jgi:hypothetical protein
VKSKVNLDPRILENAKNGSVLGDAQGLKFRESKGDFSQLQWIDVEEVRAFKRDLVTTDLICLEFKKLGKEEYYEINEEMAGYHDLLELIPEHLTKFNLEWFSSIARPAFASNHQVIWKRIGMGSAGL